MSDVGRAAEPITGSDLTTQGSTRVDRQVLSPLEGVATLGVSEGLNNKQIASAMGRSERTVKYFVEQAMAKLGAANRAHLVALAYQRGILFAGALRGELRHQGGYAAVQALIANVAVGIVLGVMVTNLGDDSDRWRNVRGRAPARVSRVARRASQRLTGRRGNRLIWDAAA